MVIWNKGSDFIWNEVQSRKAKNSELFGVKGFKLLIFIMKNRPKKKSINTDEEASYYE